MQGRINLMYTLTFSSQSLHLLKMLHGRWIVKIYTFKRDVFFYLVSNQLDDPCCSMFIRWPLYWSIDHLNFTIQTTEKCSAELWTISSRAQWDRCWGPKSSKIETGHLFSIVKLNFNVGLFSCIFWFEAIFISKSAIFCRSLFTREKGPK